MPLFSKKRFLSNRKDLEDLDGSIICINVDNDTNSYLVTKLTYGFNPPSVRNAFNIVSTQSCNPLYYYNINADQQKNIDMNVYF